MRQHREPLAFASRRSAKGNGHTRRAGRTRLVRQVLTESILLAGAGAIAGLLLAWTGVKVITSLKHLGLPAANVIEVNPGVLGFTLVLALITGIVFGIVPALQISRPDFYE